MIKAHASYSRQNKRYVAANAVFPFQKVYPI